MSGFLLLSFLFFSFLIFNFFILAIIYIYIFFVKIFYIHYLKNIKEFNVATLEIGVHASSPQGPELELELELYNMEVGFPLLSFPFCKQQ
jgi:hypothetical protein